MEEEVEKKIMIEDSTLNSTFLHFHLLSLFLLLHLTKRMKTKKRRKKKKKRRNRKRKGKNWERFDASVDSGRKEKKWMKGKRRRREEEDQNEGEEKDLKYDRISVLKQEDFSSVCQKPWEGSWCMMALKIFPPLSVSFRFVSGKKKLNE